MNHDTWVRWEETYFSLNEDIRIKEENLEFAIERNDNEIDVKVQEIDEIICHRD